MVCCILLDISSVFCRNIIFRILAIIFVRFGFFEVFRAFFLHVLRYHFETWYIHLFQEIAILEFPTSDCFQNEAICDNTLTAALAPLEIHGDVQKDTTSCWSSRRARIDIRISLPYYLIMGRMGICFTSVATSWWGEVCCLLLCFPTGTCVLCCT